VETLMESSLEAQLRSEERREHMVHFTGLSGPHNCPGKLDAAVLSTTFSCMEHNTCIWFILPADFEHDTMKNFATDLSSVSSESCVNPLGWPGRR
jgi:hypothetical protein